MRTIPVTRETLLQRMRRYYEKQKSKMIRAGSGQFVVIRAGCVIEKFSGKQIESKSIELGILKEYEFEVTK